MTEKKNKDFMRLLDSRIKSENDRKEEQGRSMVEMLGVLAVVGVLSVGGIAGYTYAMNKHYANELLNGASQRAVILKAQKAAGLDLSLREFDGMEVAGGTFGNAEELEDGSGFIIPVSGVKGAVCENLIKATEGTDIAIAKDDGETLTDITEEECDDENPNDLAFVYKTGNGESDGNNLCAGYNPQCCHEGDISSAEPCDYSGEGAQDGVCKSGQCVLKDGSCTSYKHCNSQEYCDLLHEDSETDPTNGVCKPLSDLNITEIGETGWKGDQTSSVNWWTAMDICASMNMHKPSVEDLGCSKESIDECAQDTTTMLRKIVDSGWRKHIITSDTEKVDDVYLVWGFSGYQGFYSSVMLMLDFTKTENDPVICRPN